MTIKLIAGMLLMLLCAVAQTAVPYPPPGQPWHQPMVFVPTGSTAVTTSDSLLDHLHLSNITGSTVTITITDNSTTCGGSPCQAWPAITIAANTSYDNDFGGMFIKGGIKWSSGTGSAVEGWMKGTYTRNPVAFLTPARHGWKVFAAALHPKSKPVAAVFPQ